MIRFRRVRNPISPILGTSPPGDKQVKRQRRLRQHRGVAGLGERPDSVMGWSPRPANSAARLFCVFSSVTSTELNLLGGSAPRPQHRHQQDDAGDLDRARMIAAG